MRHGNSLVRDRRSFVFCGKAMPARQPVTIDWVTNNTQTCARSVVIPGLNYQKILPPTGRVKLEIPAQEKGTILRYTCSMGMYPSQFVFDQDPLASQ